MDVAATIEIENEGQASRMGSCLRRQSDGGAVLSKGVPTDKADNGAYRLLIKGSARLLLPSAHFVTSTTNPSN